MNNALLESRIMACMDYYDENVENKLETLQHLRNFHSPQKFDICKRCILIKSCEYGYLPIVSWLWSIEDKDKNKDFYVISLFYSIALKNSVINNHFHIIQYVYENVSNYVDSHAIHIDVFHNLFYKTGFMMFIDIDDSIIMLDFIYNLFKIKPTRLDSLFQWACRSYSEKCWGNKSSSLLARAKWCAHKKPWHYEFILDETQTKIVKFGQFSRKDIRWNSVKSILFMSQIKPENPQKSSIFRFIPDDVVRAEICSFLIKM